MTNDLANTHCEFTEVSFGKGGSFSFVFFEGLVKQSSHIVPISDCNMLTKAIKQATFAPFFLKGHYHF